MFRFILLQALFAFLQSVSSSRGPLSHNTTGLTHHRNDPRDPGLGVPPMLPRSIPILIIKTFYSVSFKCSTWSGKALQVSWLHGNLHDMLLEVWKWALFNKQEQLLTFVPPYNMSAPTHCHVEINILLRIALSFPFNLFFTCSLLQICNMPFFFIQTVKTHEIYFRW